MTIAWTHATILLLLLFVAALVDARRIQQARIINGADAPRGRYPWVVLYLFNGETVQCGGSLIAPDMVVTAAHCYEGTNSDLGYVSIGKYNISDLAEGNPIVQVVARYPHPDYARMDDGSFNPNNDIALLKLTQPAINAQLIRMNANASYPSESGEELLMLGWGSTTNGVDVPYQSAKVLQQGMTEYMPFEICAVAEIPGTDIKFGLSVDQTIVGPDWLCTDDPETNHCVGDSGGPIIRLGDTVEDDLLVAVISGSPGECEDENFPQINQRISHHYDWIREVGCQISVAPLAEWGCSGSNASTTKPTEVPTKKPSQPPSINVPTLSPTIMTSISPSNLPSSLVNSANPTLAPSTVTILQPSTEREDDTSPSPVLATISGPTSEPTVSTMIRDNTTAPTLDPGPTAAPTNSLVTLYIKIIFDDSPHEIGWFISDANYSRFRVAVPFGAYVPSTEVLNDQVSVMGGDSYQFVISDSAGNGLSGGGSYEVYLGQEFGYEVLATGSGDFGTNETTIFFVPTNTARLAPSANPSVLTASPAPSTGRSPTRSPTRASLPTRAPSSNTASINPVVRSSSGCFCQIYIPSLILATAVFVATICHI